MLDKEEIQRIVDNVMLFIDYLSSKGELKDSRDNYLRTVEEAVIEGAKAQYLKFKAKS